MHTIEPARRKRRMVIATGLVALSIVAFAVPPAAGAAAPAKPTVSSVFATNFHAPSGSNGGGQKITITGSHFTRVRKVSFGGVPGTRIHRLSQHKLTVILPAHPAGRVDVRVVTAAGTSNVNPHDKFYFQVRHRLDGGLLDSCQALGTGLARCWGANTWGQLGNGSTTDSHTPVQVTGLTKVVSVATGYEHACALLAGGAVWCWGYNENGELGDNTLTNSTTPVRVLNLGTAVAITAGGFHTCALVVGGKVNCWGYNFFGQLGNGTTIVGSLVPVQVHNLSNAVDVGAGYAHTCVTRKDGTEACWGENKYGQLGNGTTTDTHVPTPVVGVHHAIASAVGDLTSCILNTAHRVFCWGFGPDGERGDGTTIVTTTRPSAVSGLSNVTKLTYGGFQGCAVMASASTACWGDNFYGEVGNGTTANALTPAAVAGLANVVDVGAGMLHSLALLRNGTTEAWGSNAHGQLGDNTTIDSATPVTVS